VNIDDWDRTFAVNVRGVFLCYQYAAKQMVAQGRGGRIIGACSLAGKQGENQLTQAQRVKTMSTHHAPGESLFLARDMVRLAYIQILQE
jgi:NAD(P)-dependent dehydrogenase (short-subunit alcohol dehydrogenase family)